MTRFRKILSCLVFIIVAICMCGCADVQYSMTKLSDGTCTEVYTISLDKATIVSRIGTMRYNNLKQKIKEDMEEDLVTFVHKCATLEPEEQDYIASNFSFVHGWNGETYTLQLNFANAYLMYLYHEKLPVGDDGVVLLTEKDFYDTYSYSYYTVYNDVTEADILSYELAYPEFDRTDVDCYYAYSTDSHRWHSVGATVTKNGTLTTHQWHLTADEWHSPVLMYYHRVNNANQAMWLIYSTILGLLATIVLCVVAIVLKRKKIKKISN